MHIFYTLSAYMSAHQKRALDPIVEGCEVPCSFWEFNSDPLQEQRVLLTIKPSAQPKKKLL